MGLFTKETIEPIKEAGTLIATEATHAEVNANEWAEDNKPEVAFAVAFYLNDHDPRLYLASDTYVQLILGAGMIISATNKEAQIAFRKWVDETGFEEKVEDGAHSYVIAGNLMFEKFPLMADVKEIDITTMRGAIRTKTGKIRKYIQYVNDKENKLDPKTIAHLKFTNRRRELWGRSMFQSVISPRQTDGVNMKSAIEEMWKMEDAMVKIFQAFASPIMMIHFEDAGEEFIKAQEDKFRKAKPGTKILTDKAFNVEIFEVNPTSKFDKYVEHMEVDVIEAGSQFATQILTAGFTARASSESAGDIIKLKIKRIQKRYGLQLKQQIGDQVLKALKFDPKEAGLRINFQFEAKSELSADDIVKMFEKGITKRSELRKYLDKNTNVDIDTSDMADTPPITSVTPMNKPLGDPTKPDQDQPSPDQTPQMVNLPRESLEKIIELMADKIPKPRGRTKEEASPDDAETIKLQILKSLLKSSKNEELL